MNLLLTKMCADLNGKLDTRTGYHVRKYRNGWFIKRNSNCFIPSDGHLRMIYQCAFLAKTKLYLRDVRVSVKEYQEALDEAGSFYTALFDGMKGYLNAKQIRCYEYLFRH